MMINVLDQATVVRAACEAVKVTDMNPRFGNAIPLTEDTFKYTVLGEQANTLLIERVDLGELFANIPQDITGFTFNEAPCADLSRLTASEAIDSTQQSYPLLSTPPEVVEDPESLAQHFINWKRLVGINSLDVSEVELSVLGDDLLIDARYSTVYRGLVKVKFKQGEQDVQ